MQTSNKPIKKLFSLLTIVLVINNTVINNTFATQDSTVLSSLSSIQNTDTNLPFSSDLAKQKGNIGYLLGKIFRNSLDSGYDITKYGKIKGDYLDFSSIPGQSNASTTTTGIVLLQNSTGSTSLTNAPTSNILKSVWDYLVTKFSSVDSSISTINTNISSKISLSNLSAVSPLSYNNTTGVFSLPVATTTQNGYLSNTDWNTFNNKQNTIAGGASTITTSNLTTNKALISDASGKVGISTTTSTELGYVSGVTSSIQTQLNTLSGAVGTKLGTFGIGVTNTIPKYNGIGDLALSQIYDNGSNVGIGTTSPSEKLTVANGFSLLNSTASTTNRNYGPLLWSDKKFGIELGYDGTWSNRIYTREVDGVITFGKSNGGTGQTHFTEQMRINNAGNVGIGTTSPQAKLDIKGVTYMQGLSFTNSSGDVYQDNWVGISNSIDGLNNKWFHIGGVSDNTDLTGIKRRTAFINDIAYFNGNVGIGITNPVAKLQVTGSSEALAFGGGTNTYIGIPTGTSFIGKGGTSDYRLTLQDGNGRVNHYRNAYYDGGYKYQVNNEGSARLLESVGGSGGIFAFYGAPSGTAGSGITWTQAGSITSYDSVWFSPRGISSDFLINNNGNIGIGTSPTEKLDVVGNVKISGNLTINGTNPIYSANWGASTNYYLQKSNGLGSLINSLIYDNGTNVGIGTASPQAKLDVAGGIRIGNDTSTCTSTNAGTIRYASTKTEVCNGTSWTEIGTAGSVPAGSVMAFNLASCPTGWSEYTFARGRFLRGIDPTGTNDSIRVVGNLQDDAFQNITGEIYGTYAAIVRYGQTGVFSQSQQAVGSVISSPYYSTSVNADKLTFDASKSSGARTSTETRPKNVAVLYCQKDSGTGDATAGIWMMTGSNIYNNTVGNVGIGTTSPSEKLEVAGNIKATAFYYSSDRRLKENIAKIDNPLAKINQLNGYTFDWKKDGKKDIGVIAQEVEKVFPELVKTDKTSLYKSVEYGNLVAPIIEAIKELSNKIEVLFNKYLSQEEKINKLEKQNEDILKRIEKLENNKNNYEK